MAHSCLGVAQEEPPEARPSRRPRKEHRTRPLCLQNPVAEAPQQEEPPEAPIRDALAKEKPPEAAGKALAQEELLEAAAAELGLE